VAKATSNVRRELPSAAQRIYVTDTLRDRIFARNADGLYPSVMRIYTN
jgi:hypothetical protein